MDRGVADVPAKHLIGGLLVRAYLGDTIAYFSEDIEQLFIHGAPWLLCSYLHYAAYFDIIVI